MSTELQQLSRAFEALQADLLDADGPRISTTPNYRFAIVPYHPSLEFELRDAVFRTSRRLTEAGWHVHTVDLQHLFLTRLERELGTEGMELIIGKERRQFAKGRGLSTLQQYIYPIIEGADGLAGDVIDGIRAAADANPDKASRMVVFIGRCGALYPFFRTSALLKHLDGAASRPGTPRVPVILLYPGTRQSGNALSFMDEFPADSDYRPRIYPERLHA
jgi:hypothetical protein